jgi:hypothetical protein
MPRQRIILCGFGKVGQAFAQLLHERRMLLQSRYALELELVAVVDVGGTALAPRGLPMIPPDELLAHVKAGGAVEGFGDFGMPGANGEAVIDSLEADLIVEATPTDLTTGEPGLSHMRAALRRASRGTSLRGSLPSSSSFMSFDLIFGSRGVLSADYSSSTSPKVPIYWRRSAQDERNRAWELDRVLHATAVYCHLLRWRFVELAHAPITPGDRTTIEEAAGESIAALRALCTALTDHIRYLTAEGGLFVGRLIELSRTRAAEVEKLLQKKSIGT